MTTTIRRTILALALGSGLISTACDHADDQSSAASSEGLDKASGNAEDGKNKRNIPDVFKWKFVRSGIKLVVRPDGLRHGQGTVKIKRIKAVNQAMDVTMRVDATGKGVLLGSSAIGPLDEGYQPAKPDDNFRVPVLDGLASVSLVVDYEGSEIECTVSGLTASPLDTCQFSREVFCKHHLALGISVPAIDPFHCTAEADAFKAKQSICSEVAQSCKDKTKSLACGGIRGDERACDCMGESLVSFTNVAQSAEAFKAACKATSEAFVDRTVRGRSECERLVAAKLAFASLDDGCACKDPKVAPNDVLPFKIYPSEELEGACKSLRL